MTWDTATGALQDLRVAGGVVGDAVKALWRDEFAPNGEWRMFCEYPLIEADRLYGVIDDLMGVLCEARSMVTAAELRHQIEEVNVRGG